MQEILQHLQNIKGVIGSAFLSDRGEILAHAFPPIIERAALDACAELLLDSIHGLQVAESMEFVDLRYADGRILAKPCAGMLVVLLCARNVNLQVVNVTLNLVGRRLEEQAALQKVSPPPAEARQASPLPADVQGRLMLPVAHLADREAAASFESLGMIAVSQATGSQISATLGAPFRKLTLLNTEAGTSSTFPVMVMPDMDPRYDGSILVGPGVERKLKVNAGERVEVRIG